MAEKFYDTECGLLAMYFLGNKAKKADAEELACEIQQAVEDWFADHPDADPNNKGTSQ